jgi:hypothetical protein
MINKLNNSKFNEITWFKYQEEGKFEYEDFEYKDDGIRGKCTLPILKENTLGISNKTSFSTFFRTPK